MTVREYLSKWLVCYNKHLDAVPIELMKSEEGKKQVDEYLRHFTSLNEFNAFVDFLDR